MFSGGGVRKYGVWPVVAVVAAGGAVGASARYGASLIWPVAPDAFPWTTLLVNGIGCAVMGVFMVILTEVWTAHRLVRPFFGTGVLGGFTTFSTYIVDGQRAAASGATHVTVAYLAGTMIAALAAVYAGDRLTRLVISARRRHGVPEDDANGAGDGAVDEVHRSRGDGRQAP
jgi:CrcB protein